jgi:hypothetical protein
LDGLNESFCALPTSWQRSIGIIKEHNLPLDQYLSLIPKSTTYEQEILFWHMVFRSVNIVKAVVHVGSDCIRRVMNEFTRTHELPLPKSIGRPKALRLLTSWPQSALKQPYV